LAAMHGELPRHVIVRAWKADKNPPYHSYERDKERES